MADIAKLSIKIGGDNSELKRTLADSQRSMTNFSNGLKSTFSGIAAALAGLGLAAVVKEATSDAIKVEAAMGQISRTMGNSANEFFNWSEQVASSFGMSRSAAIQYGATYARVISSFSSGSQETLKLTQDTLKAATMISASTGMAMTEVVDRLRSALNQEADGADELGVDVRTAAVTASKAFKELSNGRPWESLATAQRKQILLMHVLAETSKNYGDTLQNNTMLKQSQLVAQLQNIKLAFGEAFLPIYNAVLPALTAMASALSRVVSLFAQFTQALFGRTQQQAQGITQQANAVNELGQAYTAAGNAARGSVAGFDEVNNLSDSGGGNAGVTPSSGATTGAGGALPSLGLEASALEPISAGVQAFADKVRSIIQGVKDFIKNNESEIVAAISGIAAGFATFLIATNWAAIIAGISKALTGLRLAFITTWAAITAPIALIAAGVALLVGAFVYFYTTNETFRGTVDSILRAIGDTAVWLWNEVLVPLGAFLADVFVAAWDGLSIAAEWTWKNVLVPFGDFMLWLWENVLAPVGIALGETLGKAFSALAEVAESFWKNVMIPLGNFFAATFQPTIEAVSAVLSFMWNNVLSPFASFIGEILKKRFEEFTETMRFLWENVLEPLTEFLINTFQKRFDTVFQAIGESIENMQTIFTGLMTFIKGVFTNDWTTAWEGVKTVFKGVFDSLYDIVKFPLNQIIDGVNQVISGLNKISIDIPDWVPEYGGKSFGVSIPKIPRLARGGIVTSETNMGNYVAGEAGTEMIVPLENTAFVDKLAAALGNAVMGAMQFNNTGNGQRGNQELALQVDGVTFARLFAPYLTRENARIGGSMVRTT